MPTSSWPAWRSPNEVWEGVSWVVGKVLFTDGGFWSYNVVPAWHLHSKVLGLLEGGF